jgi:hypothetical protein
LIEILAAKIKAKSYAFSTSSWLDKRKPPTETVNRKKMGGLEKLNKKAGKGRKKLAF